MQDLFPTIIGKIILPSPKIRFNIWQFCWTRCTVITPYEPLLAPSKFKVVVRVVAKSWLAWWANSGAIAGLTAWQVQLVDHDHLMINQGLMEIVLVLGWSLETMADAWRENIANQIEANLTGRAGVNQQPLVHQFPDLSTGWVAFLHSAPDGVHHSPSSIDIATLITSYPTNVATILST